MIFGYSVIALVGTHSETPEGRDEAAFFPNNIYSREYGILATEIEQRVKNEIKRLNFVAAEELKHLRTASLPSIRVHLAASMECWQSLMEFYGASRQNLANIKNESETSFEALLQKQVHDTSVPPILRRCADDTLQYIMLQRSSEERLRRLCGVRDGSTPSLDCNAVKMRLIQPSRVDSSNYNGISALKRHLSFCCHGLPFIGEKIPAIWNRVESVLHQLPHQTLALADACREILGKLNAQLQLNEVVALPMIQDALEFWAQLGRVFLQDRQLFLRPQFVIDLIRPLIHHQPMNLLDDTERLGMLREESRRPGALHESAKKHLNTLSFQNEVHVDFLVTHLTEWRKLSEQQVFVMLEFFVRSALFSEIPGREQVYLVTARLKNLPSIEQLSSIFRARQMIDPSRLSHFQNQDKQLDVQLSQSETPQCSNPRLAPFMNPLHDAAKVFQLILGESEAVSCGTANMPNEAFFVLPMKQAALLPRLNAGILQIQPEFIGLNVTLFSDGLIMDRGNSLCILRVRSWSDCDQKSPKLRDCVGPHFDTILHVASNDYGMFLFFCRCTERTIDAEFAGLRHQCWCPLRDQFGSTIDWLEFNNSGGGKSVCDKLSATLEKNWLDSVWNERLLNQIFSIVSPVFISRAQNDGTGHFVKRLKHYLETSALVSVCCDFAPTEERVGCDGLFRDALSKSCVIIVCLTPRYLTLPHCLRELQWALDYALTCDKDLYVLPLHPCVNASGISEILKSGVVMCVHGTEGRQQAFKLSTVALDIVRNVKQFIRPSWCDLEPWTSDALGDLWPEQVFAPNGNLRAAMVVSRNATAPAALVNELCKKIVLKLSASNRPCNIGDCRRLLDSDLEAIAICDDCEIPEGLADVYSKLYSKMCQIIRDIHPQSQQLRRIMNVRSESSRASLDQLVNLSLTDHYSDAGAAAAASSVSALAVACEGWYQKSKSSTFPALTLKLRCIFCLLFSDILHPCDALHFYLRYLKLDADGFHWYKPKSERGGSWFLRLFGSQLLPGLQIGTLSWKDVQGATRAGPWNQYAI